MNFVIEKGDMVWLSMKQSSKRVNHKLLLVAPKAFNNDTCYIRTTRLYADQFSQCMFSHQWPYFSWGLLIKDTSCGCDLDLVYKMGDTSHGIEYQLENVHSVFRCRFNVSTNYRNFCKWKIKVVSFVVYIFVSNESYCQFLDVKV